MTTRENDRPVMNAMVRRCGENPFQRPETFDGSRVQAKLEEQIELVKRYKHHRRHHRSHWRVNHLHFADPITIIIDQLE